MRRLLFIFVVAVGLVGGLLFFLNPAQLAEQLAGVDGSLFALGLVAVIAALACWSEASRQLFAAVGVPLSRRRAVLAYGAGAFGKQVLPMGNAGGPAIMAFAFNREVTLGYSQTLAIIVVAELLSLVASIVLAGAGIIGLLTFGSSASDLTWLGVGVGLVGAMLVALSIVVWYRRRHVRLAFVGIARLLRPLVGNVSESAAERLQSERVAATVQRYYDTLDAVGSDRRAVLSAFALSQIGWIFFALPLYTGALALGVELSLALTLFLVPVAGLAMVVPLPGGLGGVEVVLVGLIVALASLDFTTAGAVVILFRLCSFWFFVLVCGIAASMAAAGVQELLATAEVLPEDTESDGHPK